MNTDYKILAKALLVRFSKVLANIVSEDQMCGVPGRTILNNIFILRDLVVICKQKNIPAAIISIDQMKAFDRVNWSFMYKTLRAFGFKDTSVRWIQLLYTGAKSIVKVNGFLSDRFDESIERLAYHLDLYKKASGAKVNREKCEGLWLGSNQN